MGIRIHQINGIKVGSYICLGNCVLRSAWQGNRGGADRADVRAYARQGQVMKMAAEWRSSPINRQGGIKSHGRRETQAVGIRCRRFGRARQECRAAHGGRCAESGCCHGCVLSSFTLAVTEVTERAELPVVTFSYSDLITSRGFKYVFQTSATGVQQAEGSLPALLEMAEKSSGQRPKTIGIVMDNTAASVSFVKPMRDHQFEKLGPEAGGGRNLHPAAGQCHAADPESARREAGYSDTAADGDL